jgi:hypothetical protein
MSAALESTKPSYASTSFASFSVADIEATKPQLKLPARIAIAPPVQAYRPSYTDRHWASQLNTWSPEEVDVLQALEKPLRAAGIASEVVVLPSSLVAVCGDRDESCRVDAERAAAARARADALLMVDLATDTDEYVNPASALYLTIIGMWLVPGTHRNALTVAEGVLIDNRNEYLYAFARGQGESKSLRPLIYADTASVVHSSRVEALRSFDKAFLDQARQLAVH